MICQVKIAFKYKYCGRAGQGHVGQRSIQSWDAEVFNFCPQQETEPYVVGTAYLTLIL